MDAQQRIAELEAALVVKDAEIWEQIETKVTGDEHLGLQATADRGFIGAAEAVRRIQVLAATHLKV